MGFAPTLEVEMATYTILQNIMIMFTSFLATPIMANFTEDTWKVNLGG